MRARLFAGALLATAFTAPVAGQTGSTMSSGTAPIGDATFVNTAAISDMYEIKAAHLAQTKATGADEKTFASRMITDHTKTTNQLKSILASKSGMKPPAAMDTTHKALIAKLKAAGGASFDSLYAQQQVRAHQEAVMLFASESQNGQDPDLKTFATQTLPTLQQHLSMAEQLSKGGAAP